MDYINKLKAIIHNLEKCERVVQYSTTFENEADTLANSFIDIEESLNEVINEKIPKLYLNDLTKEEVDDLILDIGEDFKHILYHIRDTKVYGYLYTDKND